MSARTAEVRRHTNETNIHVSVNLDGQGQAEVATGVGFFDHMLTHLARHSLIDMTVRAVGDLHIDAHHTVEDTGITLGMALAKALGEKVGIRRFGSALVPMDETLAEAAVDLSGRAVAVVQVPFTVGKIGDFETELVAEFVRALAGHLRANIHIQVRYGTNNHHLAEGAFKALARALGQAVGLDGRVVGIPSTKGSL